jgi:hypothetical protein
MSRNAGHTLVTGAPLEEYLEYEKRLNSFNVEETNESEYHPRFQRRERCQRQISPFHYMKNGDVVFVPGTSYSLAEEPIELMESVSDNMDSFYDGNSSSPVGLNTSISPILKEQDSLRQDSITIDPRYEVHDQRQNNFRQKHDIGNRHNANLYVPPAKFDPKDLKQESSEKLLSSDVPSLAQSSFSAEQILNEDIYSYSNPRQKKVKGDPIITQFAQAAKRDMAPIAKTKGNKASKWWAKLFRILNFLRSLLTSVYSILSIVNIWNNPQYLDLGAKNFFYSVLAFACLDLLITIVKAFPNVLWLCWDVSTWDPFERTFSIWNLVADHEMILDVSPLIANVILKIYGYRMGQLVVNNEVGLLGITMDQRTINLTILIIFCVTLLITVVLHTLRLSRTLISKSAFTLTFIVWVKVLLLLFDLATNSLLLYSVLVFQQQYLFELNVFVNLVLAIFAGSLMVTLSTNVLVNLPLHYTHIRMSLRGKILHDGRRGESVSVIRVLRAAAAKTFHPFIFSIFGTYAIFSTGALVYILYKIYNLDYNQVATTFTSGLTSGSTLFSDPQNQQKLMEALVTINFFLNYVFGVTFGVLYWIFQLLRMFTSIWLVRQCFEGCRDTEK